MRKFLLFICLMAFVGFTDATTYLVQPGGSGATWNGVPGTLVDLTVNNQSLNAWYKATTFSASDQIWLIKGTYVLTDSIVTQTTEKIYGGFAGTEQTVDARTKGTNAWDFTNETIIDGNASVRGIVSNTGATIDGLSIQNCAYTTPGNCAAAVKLTAASSIVQNCIVRNNTITGSTTGYYSGGVYLTNGAQLLNSYIHNNSSANTAGGGNGGGVTIYGKATVTGCTISYNTAYASGGGVQVYASTGGALVQNSTISNNTTTNSNGGGVNTSGSGVKFSTNYNVTFSNCTISTNTAKFNGGGLSIDVYDGTGWQGNPVNITNCTISSNTASPVTTYGGGGGGIYIYRVGTCTVSGCTIQSNTVNASNNDNNGGGGIYTKYISGGILKVTNCIIQSNSVANLAKNVGSFSYSEFATQYFTNCLITGNKGNNFYQSSPGAISYFYNCTFAGNTNYSNAASGMYLGWNVSNISTVTNCLFYQCSASPITGTFNAGKNPVVTYCGFDLSSVPTNFASPTTGCIAGIQSTDFSNSANNNWSLSPTSAAIDAGTTIAGVTTDITGTTVRPQGAAYDMGAYEYAPNTNVTTSVNASGLSLTSGSVLTVSTGGTLTIDAPTTLSSLTIKQGGKVTNNSGKSLTTTNFTINSDATGTGTYVDNGTTTVTGIVKVNQRFTGLTGSSTRPWWYVSSPVSGATAAVFNVAGLKNKMTSYDETVPGYRTQFSSNTTALTPGVGYVVYIGGNDSTYTFTGGSLNTGAISIPVTRTGTTAEKRGFNLIGNPYPSYLDWGQVDTTNVLSTIWYRSFSSAGKTMVFDTYNGKLGIAINNSNNGNTLSQYIPPMQAFWVKVRSEKANVSGLTVNFTNAMRSHQSSSVAGLLRSPKSTDQKILRLQVSNGINSDQTVIATNANASNGFDDYDSPKMSNDNVAIPEIYTLAGTEMLAINGLNSISADEQLPLGFKTDTLNNFTIQATQVSNFDAGTRIILKDNVLATEQDITDGTPYSFSSNVANTTSRFTLIFKSPSTTTGLSNQLNDKLGMYVYKNSNNQIVVHCATGYENQEGTITVCNAIGQKLVCVGTTGASTVIQTPFGSGVYFVTLNVAGEISTKKVILN